MIPEGDEILKNFFIKHGKSLIALASGAVVFSLVLASIVILPSPAAAASWAKNTDDATLLEGIADEWGVVDAWVIKDGSTYKMWYTHAKTDLSITGIASSLKAMLPASLFSDILNDILALDIDALLTDLSGVDFDALYTFLNTTSTVIGYATSSDGVDWTVVDAEVFAGSSGGAWDSVGTPNVVKTDNSTYEMWYSETNVSLDKTSLEDIITDLAGDASTRKAAILSLLRETSTVISYATSVNGTNWTPVSSGVLTGDSGGILDGVTHPNVVKTDNSTYEMWYTQPKEALHEADLEAILTNTANLTWSDLRAIFNGTRTAISYATSSDGETWTKVGAEVLAGDSGGIFDSVGTPSIVKTDNTTYKMWYTRVSTNITQATDLWSLRDALPTENITALWTPLGDDMTQFLVDFVDLIDNQMDPLKALLAETSTVIGYATSDNGTAWTVQSPTALEGANSTPWSSVGRPSVIVDDGAYEMWYTKGIDELTASNLVDFLLGDILPIGYATWVVSTVAETSSTTVSPELGVTDVTPYIDHSGVFLKEIITESEDETVMLTIDAGITGLTTEGDPLREISITEMEEPPASPADANVVGSTMEIAGSPAIFMGVVGSTYDIGPDGATFDQPITITFTYDPDDIAEGVNEEDLVIAFWEDDSDEWITFEDSTVDPVTHTVSAPVNHFSAFAILAVAYVPPTATPAAFTVSALSISPAEVDIGESITIAASVTNTGDVTGSYEVILKINDVTVATEDVTLAGGTSQTVTFTTTQDVAGTYTVNIDGLSGIFAAKAVAVPSPVATPAAFTVSALSISPAEVDIGGSISITVLVTNTGDLSGDYKAALEIDGVAVATEEVTLAGGASTNVTFSVTREAAATYQVEIGGQLGQFTVTSVIPPSPPFPWWWTAVGVVVVGLLVFFLVRRRQIA